MIQGDLCHWIAFNAAGGSFSQLKKLSIHFSHLTEVLGANEADLKAVGLSHKVAQMLADFDFTAIQADLAWEELESHHVITINDACYPELLREISSPPVILYVSGNLKVLDTPQLAIVGSRKPTPQGKENAYQFANYLSDNGLTITSGLATGIDAASHQGALAKNNPTIAVLGTGITKVYPKQHRELYQAIREQGVLVSEFPLAAGPRREHFPRRNRIISGLSYGVLVVEAAIKSGSLITARFALEQGREVFAMPGSIHNPQAKGCHHLIRQGAILTESLDDIVGEFLPFLNFEQKNLVQESLDFNDLDEDHSKLLACLGAEPVAIDAIITQSGFTAETVSAMLLTLELNNLVTMTAGGYCRTR